MDAGTVPPHWHDLLKYSSKKATDEDFNLAKEWMNIVDKMPDQVTMPTASGRITNPLVVVSDGPFTNNPVGISASPSQTPPALAAPTPPNAGMPASKGGNKRVSVNVPSPLNAAATLRLNLRWLSSSNDVATKSSDGFGANATTDSSILNQLLMPERISLHEAGLCCLPRL
jgi:hypothetical protein